jgi:hypothetical protein
MALGELVAGGTHDIAVAFARASTTALMPSSRAITARWRLVISGFPRRARVDG